MDLLGTFYRPSIKALASGDATWLQRYFRSITVAAAAASISVMDGDAVPADTVRYIEQLVLFWQPGAAQTSRSAVVWSSDAGGVIQGVLAGHNPENTVVAAAADRTTILTAFPMFENDRLNLAASFSGGAASNSITAYITGWQFPRGTLQR